MYKATSASHAVGTVQNYGCAQVREVGLGPNYNIPHWPGYVSVLILNSLFPRRLFTFKQVQL